MRQVFLFLTLFLFLLIPLSLAQEPTDLYTKQNLVLSLNISSSLDLSLQKTGKITSIIATFPIVPTTDAHQKVLSIISSPTASQTYEGYTYSWENPTASSLPFSLSAKIQTSLSTIPVREKISFPLLALDSSVKSYLQETNMTDYSDPAISNLANSIATGEDDAYAVAVKMADWVQHNVSYNLTTQTAEAAEPASWVLENRYGVCDELTNLYIALLRSVGIPARFVVGVAYTNSPLFSDPWSPHGWAEVYFPDVGWVPFDITYGEYGFLDATHIKLHDALDADQAGVSYSWTGRDATVTSSGITLDTAVLDAGSLATLPVTISLSSVHDPVGFGSTALFVATLQNTAPYYVPVHLTFATASELTVDSDTHPTVLLGPKETKYTYWIVHVPHLDSSYKYSFNAIVALFTNQTATATFSTSAYDPVYSLASLAPLLLAYQQQDEKTYTSQISLNCTLSSAAFYAENASSVSCIALNLGTTPQNLSACFGQDCTSFFLGIGSLHSFSFALSDFAVGSYAASVVVSNDNVMQVAFVSYAVLDIPTLEIINSTLPSSITYGDQVPVSFVLHKTSFQSPTALSVTIHYGSKKQLAQFSLLSDSQQLDFVLNSTALRRQENTVFFTVDYTDSFGNTYEKQESVALELTGLSFFQKLKLYVLGALGM